MASREWDDVTGVSYRQAEDAKQLMNELLKQYEDKGFNTKDEAVEFGENMHCMLRVYSPMTKGFLYVSHRGDLLSVSHWQEAYENILFYMYEDSEGRRKRKTITPSRFDNIFERARCVGERSDGERDPLYHRDYFTPKGTYNDSKGTFNMAQPFKYFARQTSADTSHIYTLLQHIAGVNYIYVLAWLREKMCNPTKKTEVVPVFIGHQGAGKSTFGESICTALFGVENVIVSDQFDASARFNADYADALIVCMEEKRQDDKRNDASTIKSRVTASHVRKEQKGVDPIYQESYTDYIMTSNNDVTVKFDSPEQRRFMVMEVDPEFTRANPIADEVFTRLYGYDGKGNKVGKPFTDDRAMIEQFKWELLNNKEIANTSPRDFIKTEAYERQFSMPRTNENIEIESLVKALAPFIKETLVKHRLVSDIVLKGEDGDMAISLIDIIQSPEGFVHYKEYKGEPERVAINRLCIFVDAATGKPYPHATVERVLLQLRKWLLDEHELLLLGNSEPPNNGFKGVASRQRMSPTAWFVLNGALDDKTAPLTTVDVGIKEDGNVVVLAPRIGERIRYSEKTMMPDKKGVLETVNELKPGSANRGKENAQYLDTFLLEADYANAVTIRQEEALLKTGITEIEAEALYVTRLAAQETEAERLISERKVCRAVYSGGKSIHLLIRVKDAPNNLEERKWLFAYLCNNISKRVTYDQQVGDPTRLTRAPITVERIEYRNNVKVKGTQRLLFENWANVYDLNWRPIYEAWKARPKDVYEQKGKGMLPTKEVYRDAARALMEGTFFNDSRWDGKRQECFFPAYRLVRALGYTEEQVWEEVGEQLTTYKKVDERAYWASRRDSAIIREIEGDLS